MERLVVVAAVAAGAIIVATLAQRRRPTPVRTGVTVPRHVHRADLPSPDVRWLVLAFTSATCHTCAAVIGQVTPLSGPDVAVVVVDERADRAIHQRYGVDSVPIVLIADADGAVHESFVGPTTPGQIAAALDALIRATNA